MQEEDKDKEEEPEPPPETRIDVEIPKITTDLGREIHFVKLPNFLSVETRPFDHETYEDEIDEEETLDEEGRARLKLKVENTLRWKESFSNEGKVIKESNARFVKWSDGSMSLHLGSEIFDVYKQPLQGDHNHLYIRQGTGLQGQAVFRTKLTFRPHSTESFTHRKMTMSLADRSQKTSGIKVLSQVGMNPDQNRYEMIKVLYYIYIYIINPFLYLYFNIHILVFLLISFRKKKKNYVWLCESKIKRKRVLAAPGTPAAPWERTAVMLILMMVLMMKAQFRWQQ